MWSTELTLPYGKIDEKLLYRSMEGPSGDNEECEDNQYSEAKEDIA